jgi:hypothetical protein
MAEFKLSSEVNFISRQGDICAAKIVKVLSDERANLIWWSPDTGLQSFAEGVTYSNDVVASSTFHLGSKDLTPKSAEEAVQFKLNAVESSGLENMTVAPGTGQTIQPISGIPAEQQVTPTDGKAAEKAIDPMQVPPLTPVVITDPPQQDRTGILTTEEEQTATEGSVTPPVDPNEPEPEEGVPAPDADVKP